MMKPGGTAMKIKYITCETLSFIIKFYLKFRKKCALDKTIGCTPLGAIIKKLKTRQHLGSLDLFHFL